MKVDVRTDGDKRILMALDELEGKTGERARSRMLAAGARVARRAARKTAAFQDDSGALRKSIRVRTIRKGPAKGGVLLLAGNKDARQAHLIEFGHAGPKPAPPHPFLEPAARQSREASFRAMVEYARKDLAKLAAKFGR